MLIGLAGWSVEARPADVDETALPGEMAADLTLRLARAKAAAVPATNGDVVLAADTTVIDGDRLLGKPVDAAEVRRMLASLRGRSHRVVTSIAVRAPDGRWIEDACESTVPMREYGDREIEAYLASGGPFDKAGAYGIQDGLFEPVEMDRFTDCFANVMGLPLCHVVRSLRPLGIEPPADVPAACIATTRYACQIYPSVLGGGR
jgi:MAF protein